jgi:uncharacterized protein (TIGR03437 family)
MRTISSAVLRFAPALLLAASLAAISRTTLNLASTDEAYLRTEVGDEFEGPGSLRRAWFVEQRAYPADTIPYGARQRAIEHVERERDRLEALRLRRTNATLNAAEEMVWAPLGPAPILEAQTFGNPRASVSGRVSALAFDPRYNGTSNQTIYLGGAQGGLWKSSDNGAHWEPIGDSLPSLAVGAIAIDPVDPQVIYLGTGEGTRAADSYYGAGLFKTTDGGATWTHIPGPVSSTAPQIPAFINATFMAIVVDPTTPATLYAATNVGSTSGATGGSGVVMIGNRGIWKSTDAGITWRNLAPFRDVDPSDVLDRSGTSVLIDPRNQARVYAGILNLGVYLSESGGEPGTWRKLAGGLPSPGTDTNPAFRRVLLAAGPPAGSSSNSSIFAVFGAGDDNLLGIWRSNDNGSTWSELTRPQLSGQANYNLALAIDPQDSNVIYYGTSANSGNNAGTLWRSINGGVTWTDLSRGDGTTGGLHADTHHILVSPSNRAVVFTGNDGGVWRTENALSSTVSWTNLNATLSITQFQSIALHPTDPNIIIGGTQDNGTNRFNGSSNWRQVRGGDGGYTLIDHSNPAVMYHTFFNQTRSNSSPAQMGPEISTDGGDTWQRRGCFGCQETQGNINPTDRVGFYAPMALHPGFTGQSGNVIYFGTHRLYRSSNQGQTWTGLGASGDGFGADLTKGTGRLSAIAAYPSLVAGTTPPGEIVWIGTSDGNVQVTSTAGSTTTASFTNVTKAPLPNRFVTDIGLDPADSRRAVVTFSGFSSTTPGSPGHVFLTNDLGATWSDISGNLPDIPVTSAALNPSNRDQIFIGTDLGVFMTADRGSTWVRLGNGMPRVATFMVRFHSNSQTVVAATHGRGIFRLTMASALATVSAASFSPSAVAVESIVASFGQGLATAEARAETLPLPTVLAQTRITVRDSFGTERLAPLLYVSPGQANYLIPRGTAPGTVTITVTSGEGRVSQESLSVSSVAPALFAANSDGTGVAAGQVIVALAGGEQRTAEIATFDQAAMRYVPLPVDLGGEGDVAFLILYGSGFRNVSGLTGVIATIGGVPSTVAFAGAHREFAGLDQLNLIMSRTPAGRGLVDVVVITDAKPANTLQISVK